MSPETFSSLHAPSTRKTDSKLAPYEQWDSSDPYFRHAVYYSKVIANDHRRLYGKQASEALLSFGREWLNIDAAWTWGGRQNLGDPKMASLCTGLFCNATDFLIEGNAPDLMLRWCERLPKGALAMSPIVEIHSTLGMGWSAYVSARHREALTLLEHALGLAQLYDRNEDKRTFTVRCLLMLARLHMGRRDYQAAEPLIVRALRLREGDRDSIELAACLNSLGNCYFIQARYAEAEPLLRRALALTEEIWGTDSALLAAPVGDLGAIYVVLGRIDEAEAFLKRALAITTNNHMSVPVSHLSVLGNLGVLYFGRRRYSEAERVLRDALDIAGKTPGFAVHSLMQILMILIAIDIDQEKYARSDQLVERLSLLYANNRHACRTYRWPYHATLTFWYLGRGRYSHAAVHGIGLLFAHLTTPKSLRHRLGSWESADLFR
jgi:tetratricopeptide (TPR) repeat protein